MEHLDYKNKIDTILKGNLRMYVTNDESQIRGVFDHQLSLSNKSEVDFVIARKNGIGSWLNEESVFRDAIGELFEDGYSGSGNDLLKDIKDSFLVKKEILYTQERQKVDERITTTFNVLNGLKQRLSKATADVLKNSFISRTKNGDLDDLYRNDLKFLAEDINHLLDDSEQNSLRVLLRFFSALDNCQETASFEELKLFCKNK